MSEYPVSDSDDNSNEDEAQLFRRQMQGTKPLQHEPKAPEAKAKVAARARFTRRDEKQVLHESLQVDIDDIETSSGEHLRFNRASVGRRTMRKLSRGSFSIQREIDLHGMTTIEAREALRAFIISSSTDGQGCVRVIHGKGLGSGERGPVLKRKVNNWLRQWDEILAFVSARQVDGGTGAVYVLLDTR